MELFNEIAVRQPNSLDDSSFVPASVQLADFELCLVGGGMGDVQQ